MPTAAPYPLSQQEAWNLVAGGTPVAGPAKGGGEVAIMRKEETEQVSDEECNYEYDPYTGEEEFGCKPTTRWETRTVYMVSGVLRSRQTNLAGAFAQAGAVGAYRFRRLDG